LKYISLIDELNIEINSISNIDKTQIIKLQKQLKAKAVLEGTKNIGELSNLIEKLKDEDTRDAHLFVEQNLWLKQILLEEFDNIKISSFKLTNPTERVKDSLIDFIHPFLIDLIKPALASLLSKGEYTIFYRILQQNRYFSEEVKEQIISFLRAKLNFATVYLNKGRVVYDQKPIAYLTNHNFISSLNIFPNSFIEELQEVNSEVIDIYNRHRRRTTNSEFVFAAKVMTMFGNLDIANVFLKDLLDENAGIAKEYAYPSSSSSSSSNFGTWPVIVIIFIVLRIVFFVSKSFRSNNNYTSPSYNNVQIKEILESIEEKQKNVNPNSISTNKLPSKKKSDHIRFIYSLKRMVNNGTVKVHSPTINLKAYSNPYRRTFNSLNFTKNKKDKTFTNIKNNTLKDLIVFRLTAGEDEAIIIPKDNNINVEIIKGDSLLFYVGKEFTDNKFSHFKNKPEISELYKISALDSSIQKSIVINRTLKKATNKDNTIKKKYISTKNVTMRKLSINSIYTKYYNKNYR